MPVLLIILFIAGIFAILLEAVLPFGISATIGFLILGFSCWMAVDELGPNLGILYCIFALVVSLVVARYGVRAGLKLLTLKAPPGDGASPAPGSKKDPRVGDVAEVVQPLRPTGTIRWENRRLSARARVPEMEIEVGTKVRVLMRESIYWIVEPAEASDETGAATASD